MDPTPAPEPHHIARAPLIEAIFELHWQLQQDSSGLQLDPGLRVLIGSYYERVRTIFPALVDLPQAQAPEEVTPYIVRHQFRRSASEWPVTQLGPGLMTVNETGAYGWDTFQPLLETCVNALFASYPVAMAELIPKRLVLKYLNAVRFDPNKVPPLAFLSRLHTSIQVDASLPSVKPQPSGIALHLAYPLRDFPGRLEMTLSTGLINSGPAIIWDNSVVVEGESAPKSPPDILTWAARANDVAAHWFAALSRGELYESFVSPAGT